MRQPFDFLDSQDVDSKLFIGQLKCQELAAAFGKVLAGCRMCCRCGHFVSPVSKAVCLKKAPLCLRFQFSFDEARVNHSGHDTLSAGLTAEMNSAAADLIRIPQIQFPWLCQSAWRFHPKYRLQIDRHFGCLKMPVLVELQWLWIVRLALQ